MRQSVFGWRHAGLALCCMLLCIAARADGALHPLWEVHGKHNTVYLLGSIHVLRPGDVQHLHAGRPQRRGRAGHRGVDRPGALRAAGDHQYRPGGPEAESLPGGGAQRGPVEPGDRRPQRDRRLRRSRHCHVQHRPRFRPPGHRLRRNLHLRRLRRPERWPCEKDWSNATVAAVVPKDGLHRTRDAQRASSISFHPGQRARFPGDKRSGKAAGFGLRTWHGSGCQVTQW